MEISDEHTHILRVRDCWSAVATLNGVGINAHGGPTWATSAAGGGTNAEVGVTNAADGGSTTCDTTAGGGTTTGSGTAAALCGDIAAATPKQGIVSARAEELAKSTMTLNVRVHHFATIRLHRTACGVWEALAGKFRSSGIARVTNLRRELATMDMRRRETIVKYFIRGRTIARELQELGAVVDDEQLLACLPAGLLDKFQLTQEVLLGRQRDTVLKSQELLQATETRAQRGGSRPHDDGIAFKTAASPKVRNNPKKNLKDDKSGKGIKVLQLQRARTHLPRVPQAEEGERTRGRSQWAWQRPRWRPR